MNEDYIVDLKIKAKGVDSATKKIKALEVELSKLDKTSDSYKQKQIEIGRIQNASGQSTQKFSKSVGDAKGSVGGLTKGVGLLSVGLTAGVAAAGALAAGLVAVGAVALDLTKEFKGLEKQLKSTGAQGATLRQLGNDAKFLQDNFDIDATEFAASVNNLVQNFGITTQEAANAIKEAAIAGGNSTGQLTDLINEYSTQAAAGGKNAKEFFDTIVSGASLGAFQQNKLLDVSKEVTLRYKENTKAVQDALIPLGQEFNNNLRQQFENGGKNIDEVLLSIIERTKELNLSQEETQKIIADLGGGPLEDLGSLDRAYKLITQSVDATRKATEKLTQEEIEANTRAERKIALQRELSDTVGTEVLRVQNALTDAVFDVLEAIDTSGDGLKGLADDIIEFIDDARDFVKDIVIAFRNLEVVIDKVGIATRVTLGIITGGLSELIRLIPDAVSKWNELTGAADEYNRSQNEALNARNSNLLIENLDEIQEKYKEVGGTASRSIDEIVKKEKSLIKAREQVGILDEKETERIRENTKTRVGIIDDGEKRRQQIISKYSGKISEDQQKDLEETLAFYIANNEDIATDFTELRLLEKRENDKALEAFLSTLNIRETKTVSTSNKIKKQVVDNTQAEIDAFNNLRKSFESGFERQRLQAQEDRLNGLITEEELQARIFAINQQENAVLISIIQNKNKAAQTGDEDLEVQRLTVKSLEEQSDELTRQLTLRNRLREAEQNLRESEFDIRRSELAVEREKELQAVITDESIEGEEDRQKELQKVRDKYAEKERQLRIEQVKQQIQDTQAELSTLSQGSTDTSTEAGILNSEKIAETTAAIAGLKAELAGLETQQAEAANKIDTDTESTLDKFAAKAERVNQYFQQVTEGFKEALQADIAATEASLSAQETRIEAGIELAKQGNEELLNQELERQEELLRERERQANQEKAIAAIQVAANLAVAIAKAAAEGGGFGSAATIAAVLGAVGVGLATVPGLISGAFADGVINFQGKGTERSDSNIVAISKGESVITAKGTKNASKLLTGINEGRIKDSDYLSSTFDLDAVNQVSSVIDLREEMYEQISLSAALLDEMRSFYTKIDFTDKGLQQYMQTKNKRITKINKR